MIICTIYRKYKLYFLQTYSLVSQNRCNPDFGQIVGFPNGKLHNSTLVKSFFVFSAFKNDPSYSFVSERRWCADSIHLFAGIPSFNIFRKLAPMIFRDNLRCARMISSWSAYVRSAWLILSTREGYVLATLDASLSPRTHSAMRRASAHDASAVSSTAKNRPSVVVCDSSVQTRDSDQPSRWIASCTRIPHHVLDVRDLMTSSTFWSARVFFSIGSWG